MDVVFNQCAFPPPQKEQVSLFNHIERDLFFICECLMAGSDSDVFAPLLLDGFEDFSIMYVLIKEFVEWK